MSRYGVFLVLFILAAVTVGFAITSSRTTYVSTARVQLTATPPASASEAASLVAQAKAVVTSNSSVTKALSAAHAQRNVVDTQSAIGLTGLGGSAAVDLTVSDRSPTVARALTSALAGQLVEFVDSTRLGGLPHVLKDIDVQLAQLAQRRAPLAGAVQVQPTNVLALNRLSGIDRLISDLSSDRNTLAVQEAASATATMIDPAGTASRQHSDQPQVLALAGLAGLVLGLLLVALAEVVRPTVAGGHAIARELSTTCLGHLATPQTPPSPDLVRRLWLVANRNGVRQLVVLGSGRPELLPPVVTRLAAELVSDVSPPTQPLAAKQAALVAAGRAGEQASASAEQDLAAQPAPVNGRTVPAGLSGVWLLEDLALLEEDSVGVVAVSRGRTTRASVEQLADFLELSGWPLLGLLTVGRSPRISWPTGRRG